MEWLIHPVSLEEFFSSCFEKTPKLLRNDSSKFSNITSIAQIKGLVFSGKLQYGKQVDVTHYDTEKGRITLNETGVCNKNAWNKFESNGYSLRLLRPQQHIESIYRLCAYLEAFVECMVGANIYLTPAKSQGFAPHFDDIDAFICQIEGQKRWRVYKQRADGLDHLPRKSSIDFDQEEVEEAGCYLDVVLREGDVLYLPRGYVHQAETSNVHSLHVTISMFQQWTWADLLLRSFKVAIESAAAQDMRLRRTLPLRFTSFMGLSNANGDQKKRRRFEEKFYKMFESVIDKYPIDSAADAMAELFMQQRLPPPIAANRNDSEQNVHLNSVVKCTAGAVARVIMGSDGLPMLLNSLSNSKESTGCRGESSKCLPAEAFAVDKLLKAYPHSVRVRDVTMAKEQDRIDLVEGLIDMGLVKVVR